MKNIRFLRKLHSENKLDIVEPSSEICSDYIKKSSNSLKAAKILQEQNLLEEGVSMAYYSMYHTLTALFFKVGIKCENHAGAIILLKELFHVDNSVISFAKKERVDKQYYTDFRIKKDDVIQSIKSAEDFRIKIMNFIEQLKNEQISKFRTNIGNTII
tara:strand:+ start:2017 stop:2490 length:474 start_codon:yes stop_codon:yes gene_type:complete